MQAQWISNIGLCKRAVAGAIAAALAILFAPLPMSAGAQAPQGAAEEDEKCGGGGAGARGGVYSVINMWSASADAALLNERGQAAFASYQDGGVSAGFFDGDRVHDIGSLGGRRTRVRGLNNHGVVVGTSEAAGRRAPTLPYRWTLDDGMRALAGTDRWIAAAINDRDAIAGAADVPVISRRAIRWNPDGTVTALGPLPPSSSQAVAINEHGFSSGHRDAADGIHAMLWDRDGVETDLGTLGGRLAFGDHVNERNEVAGGSDTTSGNRIGFFWSRHGGMVPIEVEDAGQHLVNDLNDRGEAVGDADLNGSGVAYHWSRGRGTVLLPSGPTMRSSVRAINNRGEMVGAIGRPATEGGGWRAVQWPTPCSAPIELNTRLHHPPPGLVLGVGLAINDRGVILAHSNAGLVMLRPGKRGTDAPVLGPIAGFPDVLEVGRDLALTVDFLDTSSAETHTASVIWTDGCPAQPPTVTEAEGVGQVRLQHRLCKPGPHAVEVLVTDSGGRSTRMRQELLIVAP